jgi:hypothetical protein
VLAPGDAGSDDGRRRCAISRQRLRSREGVQVYIGVGTLVVILLVVLIIYFGRRA